SQRFNKTKPEARPRIRVESCSRACGLCPICEISRPLRGCYSRDEEENHRQPRLCHRLVQLGARENITDCSRGSEGRKRLNSFRDEKEDDSRSRCVCQWNNGAIL